MPNSTPIGWKHFTWRWFNRELRCKDSAYVFRNQSQILSCKTLCYLDYPQPWMRTGWCSKPIQTLWEKFLGSQERQVCTDTQQPRLGSLLYHTPNNLYRFTHLLAVSEAFSVTNGWLTRVGLSGDPGRFTGETLGVLFCSFHNSLDQCLHPTSWVPGNGKGRMDLGEGIQKEQVGPAGHGRCKPSEGGAVACYHSLLLAELAIR